MKIVFGFKKLIGDTIYTVRYTSAERKIIYNLMNNTKKINKNEIFEFSKI